jgi:hypothetical protein
MAPYIEATLFLVGLILLYFILYWRIKESEHPIVTRIYGLNTPAILCTVKDCTCHFTSKADLKAHIKLDHKGLINP